MAIPARHRDRKDADRDHLRFPDVADFPTVEEYDEAVKGYWDAIERYRLMATELYDKIKKDETYLP